MEQTSLPALVRKLQNNYVNGTTTISKYVQFNMYETINTISAYLNSKHTSGLTDSMGREKPFFNIVVAAANIWYRATDIDRNNINLLPRNISQTIEVFILEKMLKKWMDDSKFGQYLNDWGLTLARYGSAVTKTVKKDGKLYCEVVPWDRLIVDVINFNQNPVIEKLYLTPAEVMENEAYNLNMRNQLVRAHQTRRALDSTNKDNLSEFIEIYEIHGNLPKIYMTGNEDDKYVYQQQMAVISYVPSQEKKGEYDDFILYSGVEKKNMYSIATLLKRDGASMGIGAVEYLFEAQWMVNHNSKLIKDQLDLASRTIMQTSDESFTGRNFLDNMQVGDIVVHAPNQPLTQMDNTPRDVGTMQNVMNQWKQVAQEIASTPDSLMGNTAPSGTAWRQVEALQQEAHSLFEIMTENKALALEDLLREQIIPYFKEKISNSKDEVMLLLDHNGVKTFDDIYVPQEAIKRYNQKIFNAVLNDNPTEDITLQGETKNVQQELTKLGTKRSIKPSDIDDKSWGEVFNGVDCDPKVEITDENGDKQATLTTLTTVLKTVANDPVKFDFVFNKILTASGTVSPVELPQMQTQPNTQQPMQAQQPVGGQ